MQTDTALALCHRMLLLFLAFSLVPALAIALASASWVVAIHGSQGQLRDPSSKAHTRAKWSASLIVGTCACTCTGTCTGTCTQALTDAVVTPPLDNGFVVRFAEVDVPDTQGECGQPCGCPCMRRVPVPHADKRARFFLRVAGFLLPNTHWRQVHVSFLRHEEPHTGWKKAAKIPGAQDRMCC